MITRRRKHVDLVMSVKTGVFRKDDPANEMATSEYEKIRRKVLEHDRYTCQGCGFRGFSNRKADNLSLLASGYLEIHHLNDDHKNQDVLNLATLCPFCHMVFHIGFAAHKKRFTLIYFPWLTQAQLNLLTICTGVAISRNGKHSEDAKSLLKYLASFNGLLKVQFNEDLIDPVQFATALATLANRKKKAYQKRKEGLSNFRLLPDINKFKTQIQYWANTTWLPGQKWEELWEKSYRQWQMQIKKI